MAYKVISASPIHEDIRKAVEWYILRNKPLAKRFLTELKACRNFLQKHPKKVEIRYQDIRIAYLKTFPYGIHFQLKEDEIILLAVYHTSENPSKWAKR